MRYTCENKKIYTIYAPKIISAGSITQPLCHDWLNFQAVVELLNWFVKGGSAINTLMRHVLPRFFLLSDRQRLEAGGGNQRQIGLIGNGCDLQTDLSAGLWQHRKHKPSFIPVWCKISSGTKMVPITPEQHNIIIEMKAGLVDITVKFERETNFNNNVLF